MASCDPFDDDDDDDLFNDAATLALLEQQAIQSTQAQPGRQTKPYHHTVAQPKAGPSKPAPAFGGRKAPAPLNTNPGTKAGGFGWEHGGKRTAGGNLERSIANVNQRQAYWMKHVGEKEDESLPLDMVVKDGGYGFDDAEVVDSHTLPPTTISHVDPKHKAAAEARRLAIAQASQEASPSPGPSAVFNALPSTHASQTRQQPFPLPNRAWARSVSAGNHPVSRPPSRGLAPSLAAIPSQGPASQTPPLPASQGSLARKAVLDLDEERRKREEAEAQVALLKKQLDEQKRKALSSEQGKQAGKGPDPSTSVQGMDEMQQHFKKLQGELWTAKGEAESIRRAQKDEQARHLAEAERLRSQIGDMEARMRERERESSRQVENVKTQAIFANHAARNSAMKNQGGASSQRPAPSPVRNTSPRGNGDESFFLRSSVKGKGKGVVATPAPRFQSLNNAFDSTPSVSRVKRQKTRGATMPGGSPSPTRPSPTKASQHFQPGPFAEPGDIEMGDVFDQAGGQAAFATETDEKQELLYHLFNYTPTTRYIISFDTDFANQSALYRLLSYRTQAFTNSKHRAREWEGRHTHACVNLLAICGKASTSFDEVAQELSRFGCELVDNIVPLFLRASPTCGFDMIALIDAISLLASTAWRFPSFGPVLGATTPSIGSSVGQVVECIYHQIDSFCTIVNKSAPKLSNWQLDKPFDSDHTEITRWPAPSQRAKEPTPPPEDPRRENWLEELTEAVVSLFSALCMFADDSGAWNANQELRSTLHTLLKDMPSTITVQGASLLWAACTFKGNFRSIMTTGLDSVPLVLDRACHLLISPPLDATEEQVTQLTIILLRALSMLTVASDEAIVLVANASVLVPALIIILRQVSSRIWGVWPEPFDLEKTLEITTLATTLFHHLVFPHLAVQSTLTTASQRRKSASGLEPDVPASEVEYPQGINLVDRMKHPLTRRDFVGLDHQFISALGLMGWSTPTEDVDGVGGFDLADVQDMSIDILEQLVEGPELDAVYELYPDDDDVQGNLAAAADEEMVLDEVDEDEREAMDAVIVIDDSD